LWGPWSTKGRVRSRGRALPGGSQPYGGGTPPFAFYFEKGRARATRLPGILRPRFKKKTVLWSRRIEKKKIYGALFEKLTGPKVLAER